jgi:hypothetical protein
MSYISVPAEKVIELCEYVMAHAEWLQVHHEMAAIKKYAKAKRFWLFGKEIGYEKAWQNIKNASSVFDYMDYTAIFYIHGEYYEMAEKLKRLAENGNPVMVSDKHSFIFNSGYKEDLIKWEVL